MEMIRQEINGVEFWTPTEEERREAIRSSLSHMQGDHWDLKEQAQRMRNLNGLYMADQRHLKNHPYHGTYTGLVEKNKLGKIGFVHWLLPDHKSGDHFAPVE